MTFVFRCFPVFGTFESCGGFRPCTVAAQVAGSPVERRAKLKVYSPRKSVWTPQEETGFSFFWFWGGHLWICFYLVAYLLDKMVEYLGNFGQRDSCLDRTDIQTLQLPLSSTWTGFNPNVRTFVVRVHVLGLKGKSSLWFLRSIFEGPMVPPQEIGMGFQYVSRLRKKEDDTLIYLKRPGSILCWTWEFSQNFKKNGMRRMLVYSGFTYFQI